MKVSINKFLENPVQNTDEYSNFYDWFCSEKKLEKRMLSLIPKIKFLVKEGLIDGEKNIVWFKNNCPLIGTLYDDFRISTLDGNFLGGFCPKSGHNKVENKCYFWFFDSNRNVITKEFKNWMTFKKEAKINQELRDELKSHFL